MTGPPYLVKICQNGNRVQLLLCNPPPLKWGQSAVCSLECGYASLQMILYRVGDFARLGLSVGHAVLSVCIS